jgi:hypothetical protein
VAEDFAATAQILTTGRLQAAIDLDLRTLNRASSSNSSLISMLSG